MAKKWVNLVLIALTVVVLAACSSGKANDGGDSTYPQRTIEVYVPYNPGGLTDLAARVVADNLKTYFGEELVVINQASGGGAVALDTVNRAKKDGYTIFIGHQAMHTGHAIGQLETKATEMTALGTLTDITQAYVVSADAPWDSLEDFVNEAKANPGALKFGADIGGTTHFMGGMLADVAGIDIKMVDVGAEAERLSALLGGHVDMVVTSVGSASKYVESGDYKALAVLTEDRDPLAPDFPTAKEQGYDLVFSVINTAFGPADLPEDVIKAWDEAMEKLHKDEKFLEALKGIQQSPVKKNSAEATEFVQSEFDYIQKLAKDLGY
ncbi:tripartite tricarboxylate transporter substrate binding protein [Sporosarcina luteola]|uniref:tripartite tricarboxylate transporter substrate binding protein n=1 Tax=Sporosarcina luteola TaxID=582850 RepID=UPI0020403509|nr:tripartite tricarboxylate transporter substrate binding protein [Sporosarcina luteola]MCM3709141.1 tripartite tricarboxylate transporter substrate binding protein [Sporosarcina luteola]